MTAPLVPRPVARRGLQLSSDRHAVLLHDEKLDRLMEETGSFANSDFLARVASSPMIVLPKAFRRGTVDKRYVLRLLLHRHEAGIDFVACYGEGST